MGARDRWSFYREHIDSERVGENLKACTQSESGEKKMW